MMSITDLLGTMASLLAAMAVGFGGAKLGIIDETFNRRLTNLLITLIHPCLVLASVLNTAHLLSNGEVLQLIGIAAAIYVVMIPLSWLLQKVLRAPAADGGTYRFMFVFSNLGFMGYPVVETLFGADATFHVTIFVLMFQLVVYTYGIHLLSESGQRFHLQGKILLRPMVLAAAAALLIYLTGLRVPAAVATTIRYVGNISTPLSMIILGCSLSEVSLQDVFGNGRIYVLVAVKTVAVPLLFYWGLQGILHNTLLLGITTVILSMPVATNATILSLAYGGNQKLASAGVFVSTILSMFTIPAIMWLLFGR